MEGDASASLSFWEEGRPEKAGGEGKMAKKLHIGKTASGDPYDILIGRDYEDLPGAVSGLGFFTRIAVVTDTNVGPLYAEEVSEVLEKNAESVFVFRFPAGEEHKTLSEVENLFAFLVEHRFDRSDLLIALGGGVVGDMTGFAAATYLRGIRFVQLPTTLLADTDSSIGGKTGVDFRSYKNMVGAFYMPSLVYISLSVLSTLPEREFSSGMAEVIKHGLIRDAGYLGFLKQERDGILSLKEDLLEEMIYQSCLIKASVVEEDPKEEGLRAILNFGHTLGHAIEKYMDFRLRHGECVSIGMAAALRISASRGNLSGEEESEALEVLKNYGLPVRLSEPAELSRILSIMKSDKKRERRVLRFILLNKPGRAEIVTDVTEEELQMALGSICQAREEGEV